MIVMTGKIRCVVTTLIGLALLFSVFGACAEDDGEKLEFTGVLVWKEFEGGFFTIDADNGKKYDPVDLPEDFKEDGLRVHVVARPRPEMAGIHMYGTLIEIIKIEAAEERSK